MAEEVVKIVVEQEARGTALKDAATDAEKLRQQARRDAEQSHPELVSEIKRNRELGDKYKETDLARSRSYYADAAKGERELNGHARERLRHFQGMAEETRKREAVEKAQQSYAARVGRAAGGVAESAVGSTPFGGVFSAVGSSGPIGAIIATIGAAAVSVAAVMAERARNGRLSGIENTIETQAGERRRAVLGGPDGGGGAARSAAEEARDERLRREGDRAKLQEDSKFRWWDPSSWKDQLTGAAEKRITDNDLAIARLGKEETGARGVASEQYKLDGGLDQEARQRRLNFDPRGARDVEHMVLARREYNRLVKEGADMEQAEAGARLAVSEAERTENQAFAGRISARSGNRAVARAAGLATGAIGNGSDPAMATRMDELIATVKRNHAEALNRRPHELGRPQT